MAYSLQELSIPMDSPKIRERPSLAAYPTRTVVAVLMASVCYLSVLSFINARGIHVSPALVGLFEALIFGTCLAVMARHMKLSIVALGFCVVAWIMFTWIVRHSPDVKSLRDLIIPLLFLSLGRYVADVAFAERCLKMVIGIVVAIALFEVMFTETYATLFNSFTFYRNISGISETAASFKGQMLSLNGYRPEGIGRTILPIIFGSHRASSVFMEPIALGNFAVIVLAWGLSKPIREFGKASFFVLAAVLIITLCDSRFGLFMTAVLIASRCVPLPILSRLAPAFPFMILSVLLALAWYFPTIGDNLHGRVTASGSALFHFDTAYLLGLGHPLPSFADMGYAYLFSRFGAPLSIVLIFTIFLIPVSDPRGIRFRAMIVLYIFASLAISGTSVFALKTAGLMWFLFGVLSNAQPAPSASTELAAGVEPSRQPDLRVIPA
jgi:putative polymerase